MLSGSQIAVLVGLIVAIASPALQAGLDVGLSAQAFSNQGDSTLRAAGYAFSIWSVIYLALAAFAVGQAIPARRDDPRLQEVRLPAAIALLGIGFWIWASALDLRWTSVAIIIGSAWMAIRALSRGRGTLVDWPMGLLAGWLTIASALNILTVATAEGLISPATAFSAALAGVAAVVIFALLVLRRVGRVAYAIPVVWGLIGVWVAERTDMPVVAWSGMAGAAIVALAAASRVRVRPV